MTEPRLGTHWWGCWKAHDDCCEAVLLEMRAVADQLADALRAWVVNDGNEAESIHALARYAEAVDAHFDGQEAPS